MPSMLKVLSKIDQKQKYCVYGWIREMEKALDITHLPLMVSSICILYYRKEENFDIVERGMTLSEDKKRITQCMHNGHKFSAYGMLEIASNQECVYQWDLKLNLVQLTNNVIGISSQVNLANKQIKNMNGYRYVLWDDGDINNITYGTYNHIFDGVKYINYCDKLNGDENISIKLDLKLKQIRFIINGKDQGVAYDNIGVGDDIKYRLLVRLCQKNFVQILNFSQL